MHQIFQDFLLLLYQIVRYTLSTSVGAFASYSKPAQVKLTYLAMSSFETSAALAVKRISTFWTRSTIFTRVWLTHFWKYIIAREKGQQCLSCNRRSHLEFLLFFFSNKYFSNLDCLTLCKDPFFSQTHTHRIVYHYNIFMDWQICQFDIFSFLSFAGLQIATDVKLTNGIYQWLKIKNNDL